MRSTLSAALAAALVLPLAALATSPLSEPGDRFIPEAEWRDQVIGKTVYYFLDGQFFGREYYFPDGRNARFQHVSGVCLNGTWDFQKDGEAYCYYWPDNTACFNHVVRDGETLVLVVEPDGEGEERPQTVGSIADGGFSCEAGLTS